MIALQTSTRTVVTAAVVLLIAFAGGWEARSCRGPDLQAIADSTKALGDSARQLDRRIVVTDSTHAHQVAVATGTVHASHVRVVALSAAAAHRQVDTDSALARARQHAAEDSAVVADLEEVEAELSGERQARAAQQAAELAEAAFKDSLIAALQVRIAFLADTAVPQLQLERDRFHEMLDRALTAGEPWPAWRRALTGLGCVVAGAGILKASAPAGVGGGALCVGSLVLN